MKHVLRVAVGLIALFNLAIGLGFLLHPVDAAARFFLTAAPPEGLATLRADFTGFFIGAALFALAGAWTARADLLRVPAVMLALALSGRCVSTIVDGVGRGTVLPMAVEVVMVAVLVLAMRNFEGAVSR